MRITVYQAQYDEDRMISLVKEKMCDYPDIRVDCIEKCVEIMETIFEVSKLPEEHFWLIALNNARMVSGVFEVSRGTLMSTLVHPREIFIRAILAGAASIIVIHNHPSGQLDVSEYDREVTRRIKSAGDILGILLDDHVLIADGDYISVM